MFFSRSIFAVNDIDIGSYVDGNTPHMVADNVNDLITSFAQASNGLPECLKNNILKNNADKFHLVVSTNDRESMNLDDLK